MSSAVTVGIEELVAPIGVDNPSGEALRYTRIYDAIQEARRADDPGLQQGDWKRDLKVANWREVSRIAIEALTSKSKDLQIAAWLGEALIKQHGFAGARDGLRLLRELQERFWETLYPLPEDGDTELRASVLEWVNGRFPAELGEVALTNGSSGGAYSFASWQESREVEEAGRRSPEALQALVAEGKITGEQWDKAIAAGDRSYYENLLADLAESCEECEKLASIIEQKFGADAPVLTAVTKVLDDCRTLVTGIVVHKREADPQLSTDAALDGKQVSSGPTATPTNPANTSANRAGLISLSPQDRSDALSRLEAIAEFFHRTEPHSPVAYLVQRAVKWGQMPLEEWLNEVISDQGVLTHIRETLGIKAPDQSGG